MKAWATLLVPVLPAALAAQTAAPLTPDEAVRLALERNRAIQVESYEPGIARANWLAAMGAFDPALVFDRGYAQNGAPASADPLVKSKVDTDTYNLSVSGLTPWGMTYSVGGDAQNQRGTSDRFTDQYASFAGVTVTQPLLRGLGFGANLAGVRIARANRSISEWEFRQVAIDTVANVLAAYSNLALAQDQLAIAHRSRDLAAGLLSENKKRLKIGSMAQSDVITARTQVAMREEAIIVAEQSVHAAEIQLRELIGEDRFPPGRPLPIVPAPAYPEPPVDPAADLDNAFAHRPDYQAARLGIAIDRASDSAARNNLLPQVNFVGSYGYDGLDRNFAASRRMVGDRENLSYSAGVEVKIPFTFAKERGQARAARLALQQAQANLKKLEADIAASVSTAGLQIDSTRRRVAADRAAYAVASQALDDEVKKLQAGTSTTLSVIQAQQTLIQIETSVAGALAAQRQADVAYDHELGLTLERRHVALAE